MSDYRWLVALELVELLTAHTDLTGISVDPGDPGDHQQSDHIWLDDFSNDGELIVPVSVSPAQPVIYEDTWTLPVMVVTLEGPTLSACAARLGALVAPVVDVVRNNASLSGAEVEAEGVQVMSFLLARRTDSVGRTPNGPAGVSRIEIEVRSRLNLEAP